MFSDLDAGIHDIARLDLDSQKHFISVLLENRIKDSIDSNKLGIPQINYLNSMRDFILSIGGFFVPNNDYMLSYLGKKVLDPSVDCYDWEGDCKWVGKLVLPIRGALGSIVGFTGYDPFSKTIKLDNLENNTDEEVPPKYTISSSKVFDRSTHLFIPNGYRKMIEDDYVIIVDGVFDALGIASSGLNSACNLGSYVNDKILFPINLVSKVLVAGDNDEAGLKLVNRISKVIKNTETIKQSYTKDLDEFFCKFGTKKFTDEVSIALKSKHLMGIVL